MNNQNEQNHEDIDLQMSETPNRNPSVSRRRMKKQESEPRGTKEGPKEDSGSDSDAQIDAEALSSKLQQSKMVMKLVREFESAYNSSKGDINGFDEVMTQSDTQIQVVRHCYQLLKQHLGKGFDTQDMLKSITQVTEELNAATAKLCELKGEFMQVNEAVINKDSNAMKPDFVKKSAKKQAAILEKFEALEAVVAEDARQTAELVEVYEDFEQALFDGTLASTKGVAEKTNQLIEEIDGSLDQMQTDLDQARIDVGSLVPQSKKDIKKLAAIRKKFNQVERAVKSADEQMERHEETKKRCQDGHESCTQLVDLMEKTEMVDDIMACVNQTRQIEQLIINHKEYEELYASLHALQQDTINAAQFLLKEAQKDTKEHLESIAGAINTEEEEIISLIKKQAAKNENDGGAQEARLVDFEKKVFESDMANHIADGDLLYLKKEVLRYHNSVGVVLAENKFTLNASIEVDDKKKDPEFVFDPSDIYILKGNLSQLEETDHVQIPRIKKYIDALEAFILKSLKSKLNDDNKKSQASIAAMKKNYEDLQKQIEALNNKLGHVKDESKKLKAKLNTEDLEKDNEIKERVDEPLAECDQDINGDKAELKPVEVSKNRPPSLQARKKIIIAAINKMVNQFNDNNKLIKDNGKQLKTEKEIDALISKNEAITKENEMLDKMINHGKTFAEQIDERLNALLDPTIPDIDEKYETKNALVDECDDIYDSVEKKIKDAEARLDDELKCIDETVAKIDKASPIENPSISNDNKDFVDALSGCNDQANEIRNKVKSLQKQLKDTSNGLKHDYQPIEDIGQREVKEPEILAVKANLEKRDEAIDGINLEIDPLSGDGEDLDRDVDKLLEDAKNKQIERASDLIDDLTKQLADLDELKGNCQEDLDKYRDLIRDAKPVDHREDPTLMGILRQLDKEAAGIDSSLRDIEHKAKDIHKKRDEAKAQVDDAFNHPEKFTPQKLDEIIAGVEDQQDKVGALNDRLSEIEADLHKRIDDLKKLLENMRRKKLINEAFAQAVDQTKDDLSTLKDLLKKLPDHIKAMLSQCAEMELDSTPDDSADYWEEKEDIKKWKDALSKAQDNLDEAKSLLEKTEPRIKELQADFKKSSDNDAAQKILEDFKDLDVGNILDKACEAQDAVVSTQEEMNDCQIPVNIKVRASEIEQLSERLDIMQAEFKDLKQADEDFEGTSESEREIKALIADIDKMMKELEIERRDHSKFQRAKLELYKDRDIINIYNAPIIKEVREHKARIADTNGKIEALEEQLKDLNTKLILQDMSNALSILAKKSKSMRERLVAAQEQLKKIDKCGDEMDGNCSHNEEEEFIEALKDEMPEVFKNIDSNFALLDKIDELIEEVEKTKSIEKMNELKNDSDDVSNKVDQCENLVNKLENEIIEWDALKKLCRRDEELGEIEHLLVDFTDEMVAETDLMEKHLEKQEDNLENNPGDKDTGYLIEGINNYLSDLSKLKTDVDFLKQDKNDCQNGFDEDIPSPVKEVRNKRAALSSSPTKSKAGKRIAFKPQSTESDKPTDMYYMMSVNCKYRKQIHEMLKSLRIINQKRRELEEKYRELKMDLNAVKERKAYVAVKGDAVDELWAYHLNKAQLDLPVIRLGPGKYLFGTRNITAKIINNKLVVRVGGGYMSADEFIAQYGQTEILKMMHNEEVREAKLKAADGSPGLGGAGSPRHGSPRKMLGNQSPKGSPKGRHTIAIGAADVEALQDNRRGTVVVSGAAIKKLTAEKMAGRKSVSPKASNHTGSGGRW